MHKLELKIPPPLVTAVAGALMWLLAWMFPALALAIPLQQPLALLLLGLGLVLPLVSVWLFIQAKTTIDPTRPGRSAQLVVSGFNRISRNPMYLGMLLVLLGWALWLSSLLAFWVPAYFLIGLKHIYRQSWKMTVFKFGLLGFCYLNLLAVGVIFNVVIGLLML